MAVIVSEQCTQHKNYLPNVMKIIFSNSKKPVGCWLWVEIEALESYLLI